ncbi:MAG: TetR/AcrR family transcriptional regulator [Deltaproteobacteria bacterium]|nr:TetR/AcrR family transcriptional regulator [Deltaproteobacteria bacterium]
MTRKGKLKPKRFQDHLQGKEGEILLSAFQCIVEKGIASASTRAIAKNANLNQGIIHYYFKSKDDLFKKVIEILFNNAINNVEALNHSGLTPPEKIEAFLDFGHSLIVPRRDEWIAINTFWGHAMTVGGEMLNLIQNQFRRLQSALIKILKEGEGIGDFSPRARDEYKDIAIFMIGAVQGLATQYAIDPGQFDPRGPINLLKGLVIDMLKQSD